MKRKYLVRALKGRVAHVWTGSDTLCRQASTGGLEITHYMVTGSVGARAVCHMCQGIIARQRGTAAGAHSSGQGVEK